MESPSETEPVGWADLPDEIVEHVYENLSAGDYIRLGLVSYTPPFLDAQLMTTRVSGRQTLPSGFQVYENTV
jgi:hypothetical protein